MTGRPVQWTGAGLRPGPSAGHVIGRVWPAAVATGRRGGAELAGQSWRERGVGRTWVRGGAT